MKVFEKGAFANANLRVSSNQEKLTVLARCEYFRQKPTIFFSFIARFSTYCFMDSLRFVNRTNQKYYCFIDVCQTIYPNTPKSTVRNWVKALQIPTVTCSAEERAFFRGGNPSLCGSFGLISDNDLQRLMDYRECPNKRARFSASPTTMQQSTTCYNTRENGSPITSSQTKSSTANSCSSASVVVDQIPLDKPELNLSVVSYEDSSSENEIAEEQIAVVDRKVSSNSQECHGDELVELPTYSPVRGKRRSTSILSLEDAPEQLRTEIKSLRRYYETVLNPARPSPPFSKITTDKMIERLMGFMFYCRNVEQTKNLSLSLFSDANLYTKYIKYITEVRKLKPSTVVNFLSVAINVVKYNVKTRDPGADPEKAPEIHSYRSYQRHFQRESYLLAKCEKEGLTKKSSQQFYFAHVLETLRNLRDKYFESSGIHKARHLHNFVLLALYMRAMPGRSKEIRSLQLYLESEKREPFNFCNFKSGNFIVFEHGQNIYIVQSEFKTAKSTGPVKTNLSDDSDLVHFLQLFVKARPSLMLGKSHDYFFLNTYGEPFPSTSGFAKYIGDVFDREVSIRASTTALRHALVTYFSTIDESKDIDMRKSLATLMKHSVRYQETVYNDQTHEDKTKASRSLLRNKIAASVFGERDEVVPLHDVEKEDENSGIEGELMAQPGDIVALLDGTSTKDNIAFFLAKVARFTSDRSEAHLVHLELLDGSENLYRVRPGKIWTEPVNALVFPVDVVYNSTEKAYELRTSAEEIFRCVHGN